MTNITKLQPRLESLGSTVTQPKMSATVSVSLLKSAVGNDGLSLCSKSQKFLSKTTFPSFFPFFYRP